MSRLATSSTVTPVALRDRPQVEDALVRDDAAGPAVEHRVVRRAAGGRRSWRSGSRPRSRACSPSPPIMRTYAHEIGRMPAEPHGAAEIGPTPVAGRLRRRAGGPAGTARGARAPRPGPTPGPPPPCGMQNVLCRLRCETSAPNVARLGHADQRVEVRAVEVDLAAELVHERADVADVLLEDAVRRRVGDHQRGEVVARARATFAFRSSRSTLPSSSHSTTTTRMPAIDRAGRVGAVRGRRDQADVAAACRPGSAW